MQHTLAREAKAALDMVERRLEARGLQRAKDAVGGGDGLAAELAGAVVFCAAEEAHLQQRGRIGSILIGEGGGVGSVVRWVHEAHDKKGGPCSTRKYVCAP